MPARPGPDQRARLPRRRPAPGFRQHHQRAARRRSTCAVVRARRSRAQRAEGERINAAEQDEIVETVGAARRRHAVPRPDASDPHRAFRSPDVTREELQALFEEAYFARFQVRLPEIRAVLVNLVTSVVGRRRSLPVAALAGGAADGAARQAQRRRPLYADGAWREARGLRSRGSLRPTRAIEGPAIVAAVRRHDGDRAGRGRDGRRGRQPAHQVGERAMTALDPLTLAVIQAGLQQVCNEMDIAFTRSAFSPVIAEADDRSSGIYDKDTGALISQGEFGLPVFVGTMQYSTAELTRLIARGQGRAARAGRHLRRQRPLSRRHASDGRALRAALLSSTESCSAGCRTPATGRISAARCRAASRRTRPRSSRRGCGCRP